jgi:hypothetical protein
MTAKLLAIAMVAALLAAQASAAPSAADARTIATCLKAAEDTGALGGECVGVIADPCIGRARDTDKSVEAGKACAARELAVWRALLRIALTRLKPGGRAVESAVAASQKSWTQSLDRLCPLFDNLDPGMSVGGADYCRLQETARRVLLLRRLADAVNPH